MHAINCTCNHGLRVMTLFVLYLNINDMGNSNPKGKVDDNRQATSCHITACSQLMPLEHNGCIQVTGPLWRLSGKTFTMPAVNERRPVRTAVQNPSWSEICFRLVSR